MMMVSKNLVIGLLTDHIPLNEIVSNLSENLIIEKLKILHNSLIKDFLKYLIQILPFYQLILTQEIKV